MSPANKRLAFCSLFYDRWKYFFLSRMQGVSSRGHTPNARKAKNRHPLSASFLTQLVRVGKSCCSQNTQLKRISSATKNRYCATRRQCVWKANLMFISWQLAQKSFQFGTCFSSSWIGCKKYLLPAGIWTYRYDLLLSETILIAQIFKDLSKSTTLHRNCNLVVTLWVFCHAKMLWHQCLKIRGQLPHSMTYNHQLEPERSPS